MEWRKRYLGSYRRIRSPSGLYDTLEDFSLRRLGFTWWSQCLAPSSAGLEVQTRQTSLMANEKG